MENKKYAPLIGKELTWELLEFLMKDIRADVVREQRRRPLPTVRSLPKVHTEDDGS